MRTRKISSIEFENFQITVEFRFTKDEQSEKIQDTCLLDKFNQFWIVYIFESCAFLIGDFEQALIDSNYERA
ncbi:hypothetical protein WICANDRAFT_85321 [Wickerhamomyces anomalus NRRL Y-366-8]|uniref:Uncharacterized protein n=1 Tax=Wickerhamomyces anomalus (strain ATCC 58044 / CBS 1984 / NCYC 433 / NRRL Y-366-8) TaxID=683960 RepID=A0A1E3NYX5_WICAA|nr:uncharacterized protein WICANDRAFT_85321 [Wickerhamomyces anomalus NRRL Y-366-8]ODQ58244.1 hypothetical protein WICANDRAFT_85321 [Wickerhamomyces anomalus NRRL Y-366-8]